MDSRKYMLLVNGQDKTDSVASFRFQNGMCEVIYANSPKSYRYHAEKMCIRDRSWFQSKSLIATSVNGG